MTVDGLNSGLPFEFILKSHILQLQILWLSSFSFHTTNKTPQRSAGAEPRSSLSGGSAHKMMPILSLGVTYCSPDYSQGHRFTRWHGRAKQKKIKEIKHQQKDMQSRKRDQTNTVSPFMRAHTCKHTISQEQCVVSTCSTWPNQGLETVHCQLLQ